MNTLYASLLDDLLPSLPGAATDIVLHELKRMAQDFFTRTRAWKVVIDSVSLSAGESDAEVGTEDRSTEIVRIEAAWLGNSPLDVLPISELDSLPGNWNASTGTPTTITQLSPNTIRAYPTPTEDVELYLRISVRPTIRSAGISSAVFEQFRSAITYGALGKLMLMPGKPWTNPTLGQGYLAQYEQSVAAETYRAALSFSRGHIRARPVLF